MVLASSLGLLSSREFVRDLAWFAEQLVMTDMTPQFFDDADKLCAACRERLRAAPRRLPPGGVGPGGHPCPCRRRLQLCPCVSGCLVVV